MPSKHIYLKLPKHPLLDKLFNNFDYVGTSVLEFVCHTPESYTEYQYYYSLLVALYLTILVTAQVYYLLKTIVTYLQGT